MLDRLTPAQWDMPSLCAGWRIREVVAHITMPDRHSALSIVGALLRARGRFDVAADRVARRDTAEQPAGQLLDALRHNVAHRWKPPGGGQSGALSHDVIHGLDITEALGIDPVSPPSRLAIVLADPSLNRAFHVDLDGYRLEATDTEHSVGTGTPPRMPARELLLIRTRRRPLSRKR